MVSVEKTRDTTGIQKLRPTVSFHGDSNSNVNTELNVYHRHKYINIYITDTVPF